MIINPISKGGKGLLPEIIVTAPSGSTLDLMQGSVVLQTYTLSSTETQHTFTAKNTGTYTVRGTSGSDTASVEVVVDVIGQYYVHISNKLIIIGDGYSDFTMNCANLSYGSITKNSDGSITMINNYPGYDSEVNFYTEETYSLKGYSKLCFTLSSFTQLYSYGGYFKVLFTKKTDRNSYTSGTYGRTIYKLQDDNASFAVGFNSGSKWSGDYTCLNSYNAPPDNTVEVDLGELSDTESYHLYIIIDCLNITIKELLLE